MYRDIFTNKWTMGGLAFLIIFAGLCFIYYQQTTAPYRDTPNFNEILNEVKKEHAKAVNKTTEQQTETTAESTTPTTTETTDKPTINHDDIISKLEASYRKMEKDLENPVDIEQMIDEDYANLLNQLENDLSQLSPESEKVIRRYLKIPTKEEYSERKRYYQSLSQSEIEEDMRKRIKKRSELNKRFKENQ